VKNSAEETINKLTSKLVSWQNCPISGLQFPANPSKCFQAAVFPSTPMTRFCPWVERSRGGAANMFICGAGGFWWDPGCDTCRVRLLAIRRGSTQRCPTPARSAPRRTAPRASSYDMPHKWLSACGAFYERRVDYGGGSLAGAPPPRRDLAARPE